MNLKLKVLASVTVMLLSACGGGGGNSPATPADPPPSTTTPPPGTTTPPPSTTPPGTTTPPPPVVVAPAPYTIAPAILETSYVAGYSKTVNLTAKQTTPFVGVAYVSIVTDSDVIDPTILVTPKPDSSVDVEIKTSSTAKAGSYEGNLTANVCADPKCVSHLAGSPFKLPYKIDVFPPEGAVIAYNQPALAALAGVPNWETFQGNAQHTGYVPVTLNPARFNARWKWIAPAHEGMQMDASTIATGGGRIYVSSGRHFHIGYSSITAYSESDGSKVWSRSFQELKYPSTNPPAFSNGKVFMSAGSQESTAMYGFDAATGTQLFKSTMASQWESYLAPTVFNGDVYTNGGQYGGLYSFVAATGGLNFFQSLPQYDRWTPAVDANNVYAYVGGTLHVIAPTTGMVRAKIADPSFQFGSSESGNAPVIGTGGIVFCSNMGYFNSTTVSAFDTLNNAVRWTSQGDYFGNPAYADGQLFAANNTPQRLEVFRESDGTLAWFWAAPSGESKFVSDVLVTQNLIFVSTSSTTYAIDRTSHAAVWNYKAGGKLAMSANGILYIKGASTIVAINL